MHIMQGHLQAQWISPCCGWNRILSSAQCPPMFPITSGGCNEDGEEVVANGSEEEIEEDGEGSGCWRKMLVHNTP